MPVVTPQLRGATASDRATVSALARLGPPRRRRRDRCSLFADATCRGGRSRWQVTNLRCRKLLQVRHCNGCLEFHRSVVELNVNVFPRNAEDAPDTPRWCRTMPDIIAFPHSPSLSGLPKRGRRLLWREVKIAAPRRGRRGGFSPIRTELPTLPRFVSCGDRRSLTGSASSLPRLSTICCQIAPVP
jgi:hypothetical protein